jgi:hypothetical protein
MADFREKARAVLSHGDFNGFTGREGQEDRIRTGGFVDTDLLIRAALFLAHGNIRYRELENKKGDAKQAGFAQVTQVWDQACAAMRESVKMFRNAGIPEGGWIPYRYLLLGPAIASAKGKLKDPDKWIGWALAASLWGHHAGNAETKAQNDATVAAQGAIDDLLQFVKTQAKRPDSAIPQEDDLTENVVRDSGVLFALLVHFSRTNVRSFPVGRLLGSHAEPIEVHHIFPRAVLNAYPVDNDFVPDRLGNLTLLFRSDNESIGDTEPAVYLGKLPEDYLKAHAIPLDPSLWAVSKYQEFCVQRERTIAKILAELLTHLGVS